MRSEFAIDLVLANVENAASGRGIQPAAAKEIWSAGVQVFTGGNHIWDKSDGIDLIAKDPRIVRPLNLPPGTPGRGLGLYEVGEVTVAVVNLLGRVYMSPAECPFRAIDTALESLAGRAQVVFIDFHGSTGYGQAFTDSITGEWGGKPLVDLQKGMAYAEANFDFIDGQNACASGRRRCW